MIRFLTLGSIELRRADGSEIRAVLTGPKRLAVLAYLALANPAGFQRRDTILSLLWPENDEPHARATLRQTLRALRTELGDGVLLKRGRDEVGLSASRFRCDARQFQELLARDEPEAALELYRGPLLNGFHVPGVAAEFEQWLDGERARLHELAVAAARALADQAAEAGDPQSAARWSRRVLDLSPLDEHAVRGLMTVLHQAGDHVAALLEYHEFARRLELELEMQPGPDTLALAQAIRGLSEASAESENSAPPPGGGGAAAGNRGTATRALSGPRLAVAAGAILVLLAAGLGWLEANRPEEGGPGSRATLPPPGEARDLELMARLYRAQRDGTGVARAVELLERAVRLAPGHAAAHASLALSYAHLGATAALDGEGSSLPSGEALLKARITATRALELDETLAEAHLAVALYEHWYNWDWAAADQAYRLASRFDDAHAEAYQWYALFLVDMNRLAEAIRHMRRARELDPHSLIIHRNYGYVLYCDRQWEAAIATFRATIELEPAWPLVHAWLRNALLKRGLDAEAFAAQRRHAELRGWSEPELDSLDLAYERGGWPAVWERMLVQTLEIARTRPVTPTVLARIHAELGQSDEAFAWLERALDERAIALLRMPADPIYDPLRGDPRFDTLLARMGMR